MLEQQENKKKTDQKACELWLDGLPGIGPLKKAALAASFPDGAGGVYEAKSRCILELLFNEKETGKNQPLVSALEHRREGLIRAEQIWEEMRQNQVGLITRLSPLYPPALQNIYDPPWALYYRGNLKLCHKRCVAVVGARKATAYGRRIAEQLGSMLAASDVTVVSGLAAGIDSWAHQGALRLGGCTAAVLGSGVDVCYPKCNEKMMKEIAHRGLLLSEYPPHTSPASYRFPQRNRIISGLCEAVIVAEAGLRSGSLITAGLAAEQGREVFAVPSNIQCDSGVGTNLLIRDGAVPICALEELPQLLQLSFEKPSPIRKKDEKKTGGLGCDEKLILKLVEKSGETSVEQLCRASQIPAKTVNGLLTVLEMKGMIQVMSGKISIAKLFVSKYNLIL